MSKTCTKCGESKALGEFYANSSTKDGKTYHCKLCVRSSSQEYYSSNKEARISYQEDYRKRGPENRLRKQKDYRDLNLEECRKRENQYNEDHREERRTYQEEYRELHREELQRRCRDQYANSPGRKSATNAKRRAAKLNRTPPWADLEAIEQFFVDRPEGYHGDHEIPLQGELVSGLHVLKNLQYLTAAENLSKGNKFNPDDWYWTT